MDEKKFQIRWVDGEGKFQTFTGTADECREELSPFFEGPHELERFDQFIYDCENQRSYRQGTRWRVELVV